MIALSGAALFAAQSKGKMSKDAIVFSKSLCFDYGRKNTVPPLSTKGFLI
jgi:hypothetical protein